MVEGNKKELEQIAEILKSSRFETVIVTDTMKEATEKALALIPDGAMVGTGGSMTINQSGLSGILKERGIMQPFNFGQTEGPKPQSADIFLTSSNAITMDGKIINIDMTGNRIAQMFWGPARSILIISQNKIAANEEEAIERVQKVLSPFHGQTMGIKAPCANDAICHDCKSPGRICNITSIIRKKPNMTDVCIILVAEDFGLGWDPAWPEARVTSIKKKYQDEWKKMVGSRQSK